MMTLGSFWNSAATATIGTFSRTKLYEPKESGVILKSSRPAASSCAWFTCGPPCRSVTSSPYFL
jgi:hypothetical protein